MPYEIRDEPTAGAYLDVRLWGTLTRGEFDRATEEMLPALHEWSRILFDAADLDNTAGVLTMVLQTDACDRMPSHLRQAAVVGPRAAGVARAWVRTVGPGSAGAQAFPAREPAVEWLLAEYQSTTGGS